MILHMRNFNRMLALSGASLAAAIGVIDIGEKASHHYQQERLDCRVELTGRTAVNACLEDTGESPDPAYGGVF
jgi:hypothetical protein